MIIPFVSNLKKPTCASKRGVLELASLGYTNLQLICRGFHFFHWQTSKWYHSFLCPVFMEFIVVFLNRRNFNVCKFSMFLLWVILLYCHVSSMEFESVPKFPNWITFYAAPACQLTYYEQLVLTSIILTLYSDCRFFT